jgi:hypothetical protein
MGARLLRCLCPRCSCLVVESASASTLIVCSRCGYKFRPFAQEKIPLWVLGVLVVLTANLCAIILL